MDGNLPPWNKHGGHNTRGPHNIAGEHQEVGYNNYISVHYDKVMTEGNYGERTEEFSHSTWLQTQPQVSDISIVRLNSNIIRLHPAPHF